jgi:dienelactone hydrolase
MVGPSSSYGPPGAAMRRRARPYCIAISLLALAIVVSGEPKRIGAAAAAQTVTFPSLADNGPAPPTVLTGYLYRPSGDAPRPGLVLLHGCGGLFPSRDLAWASLLRDHGYVVLIADSFGPRRHGPMCSQSGFDLSLYLKRPHDAYGALTYLQSQPFVEPDRVGVMGWSEGGGVVLFSIRAASLGRPATLPAGRDFRAAVAFYPASCAERSHREPWTSAVPLLILTGAADVWTPAVPCEQFVRAAQARGSPINIVVYPGAYHDFDAPGETIHSLPQDITRQGVIPIVGTDPAARADALARVPAFLDSFLKSH